MFIKKRILYPQFILFIIVHIHNMINRLIRELNLTVKYVTFNHSNMSSNLIALKAFLLFF